MMNFAFLFVRLAFGKLKLHVKIFLFTFCLIFTSNKKE